MGNTPKDFVYYQDGNATIYNADFLQCNYIEPELIDLTITSPPYNIDINYGSIDDNELYVDYLQFSKAWLQKAFDLTKDSGRLCLNIPLDKNKGGQQSVCSDLTAIAKDIGWQYHTTIIWNEGNISRRTAWGSWLSASAPYVIAPVEVIVVLYKKQWKKLHQGVAIYAKMNLWLGQMASGHSTVKTKKEQVGIQPHFRLNFQNGA